MGIPFRSPEPMTADEFFAFTATRPDGEKWELIEGMPIMRRVLGVLHQISDKPNCRIGVAWPCQKRHHG